MLRNLGCAKRMLDICCKGSIILGNFNLAQEWIETILRLGRQAVPGSLFEEFVDPKTDGAKGTVHSF